MSSFLLFISLSLSLSTSFMPTRLAYLDYNLFNLHVAMCDNDNAGAEPGGGAPGARAPLKKRIGVTGLTIA